MSSLSGTHEFQRLPTRKASDPQGDTIYIRQPFMPICSMPSQEHVPSLPHLQMRPGQDQQTASLIWRASAPANPGLLWKNPETDHHRSFSNFPFIPRSAGFGHGRGVFLIRKRENLETTSTAAAWLTSRIIFLDRTCGLSSGAESPMLLRIAPDDDFVQRCPRGSISLAPVPDAALKRAVTRPRRAAGTMSASIFAKFDGRLLRAGAT